MPNSDVNTEFDGRRDKLNRFREPHVKQEPELLQDVHLGDDPKLADDHFNGLGPLPPNLKKPKYANPRVGGYVEEQ